MFDISWTEFLLIGVVALVVIGPKELPAVMRTIGQYTRKARSMAAEFQNQFQEAMREAEMADLKKQVDDIKTFDPLKDVRSDLNTMGKDIEASLQKPAAAGAAPAAEPAATSEPMDIAAVAAAPAEPAVEPVADLPIADAAAAPDNEDIVGAATGPVVPEAAKEAAEPDSAGHTG
jgi:sec-independent protein translocase protein TatB